MAQKWEGNGPEDAYGSWKDGGTTDAQLHACTVSKLAGVALISEALLYQRGPRCTRQFWNGYRTFKMRRLCPGAGEELGMAHTPLPSGLLILAFGVRGRTELRDLIHVKVTGSQSHGCSDNIFYLYILLLWQQKKLQA